MNVEEYWGKGWSLRPEHDKSTMECLGTITRSGIQFTYYKDEKGGIWFDDQPIGLMDAESIQGTKTKA